MAGTTRLELATSAVTERLSTTGSRIISWLDRRWSATVGFIGHGWLGFVQQFVQQLPAEVGSVAWLGLQIRK